MQHETQLAQEKAIPKLQSLEICNFLNTTISNDDIHNIILNKLMSVATIFTLAAGIFLFGITTALTVNVFSITGKLEKDS